MIKWIARLLIVLIFSQLFFLFFLSFFGIETTYFNSIIQEKVRVLNPNINLEFQKTNILLDIKHLGLKVKIRDPKVNAKGTYANLSKLNLGISIKSLLKDEFALQHGEFGLIKTDIKQLVKIINRIKPSPYLIIAKKFFNEGKIEGEVEINFDTTGKIQDDYKITGLVSDFNVKILEKFSLNQINSNFEFFKDRYKFYVAKGNINEIDLTSSEFEINKENKNLKVEGNLVTKANLKNIQNTLDLFKIKLLEGKISESEISFDIKSSLSFQLENYIKLKNLKINGNGKVYSLNIRHNINTLGMKKIFTNYNDSFQFKDTDISFLSNSGKHDILLQGLTNLTNRYEDFQSRIILDKKENNTTFDTEIDIKSFAIEMQSLNYKKEVNSPAKLKFVGSNNKKGSYIFDTIEFRESDNLILIKNIEFNNKIQVNSLKELLVKTVSNNSVNNNFRLIKNKNITIQGEVFDARPFLKSLDKDGERKSLSKEFNGKLIASFKKVIGEKQTNLLKFSMISNIKKGKHEKFTAKGEFSENEFLDVAMHTMDDGKTKMIQIYSDRAKLFVHNYKFIKGFEGGKLDYESTYDNKVSKSKLKISNFKVSKVPALTQLLTLASLQGIADTLAGEGIRFTEMEMNFNSSKKDGEKVTNIEELYAIGPAISLLMEGYVVKNKLVSLKGTLVPARTVNKVIGWIPLVGKILVGNKVGEGVFGVSFKMKGPPKNIRTTVNPIKTLTPRFITRTLNKMKDMKKKGE